VNRELIIPNYHVILIHYPLGLFIAGLVIELGRFLWRGASIRAAGRWMILLGGMAMVPVALSGVYALYDVAVKSQGVHTEQWAQIAHDSTLTAEQWQHLVLHTWLMSIATGIVVLTVVTYLALSDRLRMAIYPLLLVLLLIGAGTMGAGAWLAGEAIYRLGVAVEPAMIRGDGHQPTTDEAVSVVEKINTMVSPLQPHVIMAGVAIAVALAAVGLSIRQITGEPPPLPEVPEGDALVRSLNPPPPPVVIYAGKFWIVAALLVGVTALIGWYFFASDAGNYNPKELWKMVSDPTLNNNSSFTRGVAHAVTGGALVILPLLMGALARWAPKQKLLLGLFTLILLAVVSAQLWLGILLLFDGSKGTLFRFN